MIDTLAPNQIVSERYQIISLIGEGGMGLVYRVKQIYLNKEFAFKIIKKAALTDIVIRRFQQEARAAFALKHENIIGVNDFGILDDNTPFLVMELVSGETLGQRIKRGGRLQLEEALPIFIQVCNGLDFAHKHGVVHRDVKPSNIMLVGGSASQQAPRVKIVDFGIAKIAGHEEGEIQALTRTGEIFGSPLYMSPEQCLGGRLDSRSDIYSLGCVLFEALTGLPPFVGENALSTMMKHQGETHSSLSEASLGLKFTRSFEDIINHMLAKDPADRYQSLDLVSADLQSLQGGGKISRPKQAPQLVAAAERNSQMISMTKTRFLLSLVAAGLVSVSLAALVLLTLQSHKKKSSDVEKTTPAMSTQTVASKPTEKDNPALAPTLLDVDESSFRPLTDEEIDARLSHPDIKHPNLLHVSLRTITDHALERISQSTLTTLRLTSCSIDTAGLAHLAKMKSLVSLSLNGSSLGDDCVKYLLECKQLTSLTISATNITDAGVKALGGMRSLKKFSASRSGVSKAGISSLNPSLEYLELKNDSRISNDAISAISGTKLVQIELDGSPVDDGGMKALTQIKSLVEVGLCETRVTLIGVRTLCEGLPELRRLKLSSSPTLSELDIAQLRREVAPRHIEIMERNKSDDVEVK